MFTFKIHHQMTVDDLMSLPDDFRYELHEGNLLIMSHAIMWHSGISRRITNVLVAAGMIAFQEVGVLFDKENTRTPDVAVFKAKPDLNKAYFPPEDFLTVIEVVSKSSEDYDRILKPVQYARVGIPEYWRVERDPADDNDAFVHQHRLTDGKYVETGVVKLSELEGAPGGAVDV